MGLVSIMIRAEAKVSAEVNQINGLCINPLGPWCTYAWLWGGVPEPSDTGTWRRLAGMVPSRGGAVERLVASRDIKYDTG